MGLLTFDRVTLKLVLLGFGCDDTCVGHGVRLIDSRWKRAFLCFQYIRVVFIVHYSYLLRLGYTIKGLLVLLTLLLVLFLGNINDFNIGARNTFVLLDAI